MKWVKLRRITRTDMKSLGLDEDDFFAADPCENPYAWWFDTGETVDTPPFNFDEEEQEIQPIHPVTVFSNGKLESEMYFGYIINNVAYVPTDKDGYKIVEENVKVVA